MLYCKARLHVAHPRREFTLHRVVYFSIGHDVIHDLKRFISIGSVSLYRSGQGGVYYCLVNASSTQVQADTVASR